MKWLLIKQNFTPITKFGEPYIEFKKKCKESKEEKKKSEKDVCKWTREFTTYL